MSDLLQNIFPYYPWLDALLIPIALIVGRQGQKIKAMAFVGACMLALRLQADIVVGTGNPTGFTGLMDSPVLYRGMCVYTLFVLGFLGLSYISPNTRGFIYLAACLSIFFMAFLSSFLIMLI